MGVSYSQGVPAGNFLCGAFAEAVRQSQFSQSEQPEEGSEGHGDKKLVIVGRVR